MPEERRSDDAPSRHVRARALPVIPGYRIEGVIARGATATVYRARQLAVERAVALKVLHAEVAAKPRLVQRLQREARTMARLAHPHIVAAIDMGRSDDLWWFAMELVDGPSLALQLRQSGHLDEREGLRLFIPLCEALVHLEESGVVHRDIKPANVLIDRAGGARLADLGLAFTEQDPLLTAQGGTLGTPHYISPEQACDPSAVDARADLWSFGATLFHAVCGVPPFSGDSAAEVLAGVLHDRVPDPQVLRPGLSRGLSLVLRKCLSRDLARRYANARELLLDLERVRERRAPRIDVRTLEPVQRAGSPLRWAVVALCLLALGVVGAALLLQRDGRSGAGAGSPGASGPAIDEGVRDLFAEARRSPQRLAVAFRELEAYERSGPRELAPELRDMEARLLADLRRELRAVWAGEEAALVAALEARDFAGAVARLERGVDAELLRRTGFAVGTLPPDTAAAHADWLSGRRAEVERALRSAVDLMRAAAEARFEDFLLPEVDRLQADGRWSSAARALDVAPAALVGAAGLDARGVPPDLLEEALAPLRARMGVRRSALVDAWTRVDAELVQWIQRRGRVLEDELRERRLVEGAAQELRRSFALHLQDLLLAEDELLGGARAASLRELERRVKELAALEDGLLEAELEGRLALFEDVFRPLWAERRYATLARIWSDFGAELEPASRAAAERPWRERLLRRVQLDVREAELLQDLMARAARRVADAAGSTLELHLGNITIRGRVVLDGDPLEDVFALEERGIRQEVRLRELPTRDLLALAGLDTGRDVPQERLLRGLLLFRDGAHEQALATLRSGALPAEGLDGRLAEDLRDRTVAALEEAKRRERAREASARDLLDLVDTPRQGTYEVSVVERLLDDYGDLAVVRERARELRDLRDRLRAPRPPAAEADYRAEFQPTAVELSRGRVRLVFDPPQGAWDPGAWSLHDEGARVAGAPALEWSALCARPLRLGLRRPAAIVDPGAELLLLLELEVPAEGLPPLSVSAAGFHVSLRSSPKSPGTVLERLVTSGAAAEHADLLSRARTGAVEVEIAAGTHRLELLLRPRSGRVELALDGGRRDTVVVRPPRDQTGLDVVEVCAAPGLLLRSVEVEGDRP